MKTRWRPTSTEPRDIVFRHVDGARNRRRHYAISVTNEPLFGACSLVIEWGRLGRPMRTKREEFGDARALARRWRELCHLRRSHGYVPVSPKGYLACFPTRRA